jgi:hypothetical protein
VEVLDRGWHVSDVLVIMGNSTEELRGTMALYLSQLEAAGVDYHVERIPEPDSTIGSKLRLVRKLASQFSAYKFLVFTDAFDVQFFGSKEHVIAQIPLSGVLMGAEKNCHPPECKSLAIPDAGPWRFANGGLWCGTPKSILEWCDAIEEHPLYRAEKIDQGLYNELLAEGSDLARIDSHTRLFFCLYGGYDELDFASNLPINMRFATWPNFIHANGGWSTDVLHDRRRRRMQ